MKHLLPADLLPVSVVDLINKIYAHTLTHEKYMSQLTRAAYKNLYGTSGTTFPDNTTGQISEGDVRTFGEDSSDSFLTYRDDIYTNTFPIVQTSGTDTYTGSPPFALLSYPNLSRFYVKVGNTSTGACTLNLSSLGAKKIYVNPSTQANAGNLVAGQTYIMFYDSALDSAAGGFIVIGSDGAALIEDAINNGTTDKAPSENAVFDALALKAPLASPTFTGTPAAPTASTNTDTTQIATTAFVNAEIAARAPKVIQVAVSDETTALTTGTAKVTFRMPYAMTLTAIRASLSTAQTSGSTFTVDVNEGGTTILSTKITIDNTEKTSTTAATAPVISDSALADDAEITIDIDQIGDGTAKGLKVTLIGV